MTPPASIPYRVSKIYIGVHSCSLTFVDSRKSVSKNLLGNHDLLLSFVWRRNIAKASANHVPQGDSLGERGRFSNPILRVEPGGFMNFNYSFYQN